MEAAQYAQFSRSVHERYFGVRAPLEAYIEVTRRCPLTCLHCYNNLSMADQDARKRELSVEEHFRVLDELAEMGCLWLLYTGGEIFGRKDFLEIYDYAKSKGFLITLFTNGTLISEKIAQHLAEWPPFSVEITLYGRTRETYESLTGIPGSYDRCLRGIEWLQRYRVPLKLKTVGTTVNKHEVQAMKQFATELGLEFKFDSLLNPRIDCSRAPLAVRLSPEDVVALDLYSPLVASEYRRLAERDAAAPPPLEGRETLYFCGGGMSAFALDPYGEMSICVISHRQTYNIRNGSVREGWERFLLEVRQQKRKRITKCVRCRIHSLCGMCPANGELESGDPESPVEFLCAVAHLRALALGIDVPEHGECDFCHGGAGHDELKASAERIKSREVNVDAWSAPAQLLPVLNSSGTTHTGCGNCTYPNPKDGVAL